MPSTDLSRQLAGISSKSKKHASNYSLLFKQAADVDSDSVFGLAKNGMAELKLMDFDTFKPYDDTLFSEHWKDGGDIALQSAEDRAILEKDISSFLRHLSPFFLHHCAFKALEWLIRRFRVNQFFIDPLVRCILPYHESAQFVQVVSIIQFPATGIADDTASGRWSFLLKTVQKTKIPLDRQILVQRCSTDKGLIDIISDMVSVSIDMNITNKSLWSFFSITMIHFLSTVPGNRLDENIIRNILTIVFKAAAVKKHADLQSSAMMIVAQLAQKAQLSKDVISAVLKSLIRNVSKQLEYLALLTVLVICQTQDQVNVIFDRHTIDRVVAFTDLEAHLIKMSTAYDVTKFMVPFLKELIITSETNDSHYILLSEILSRDTARVLFPDHLVRLLCDSLLKRFISIRSSCSDNNDNQFGTEKMMSLLKSIQNINSGELSAAIEQALNNVSSEKHSKELYQNLFDFVSVTFKGTFYQPLESGTTLYLSLTHSEESVRVIASEKLKLELSKGGEEVDVQPFEDKEMLSQILSDRLADSSVRVANVILSIPNLHYHVKPVALVQTLVSILWKRVKDSAANVGLNKDLPAQEIKLMCRVLDTLVHTVINFKSDMAEPMISAANEVFFASLFICKELKQVNVKAIQLLSLEALPFHLPSNVVKLQQQSAAAATSDEHSATIELANLIVDGFAESCIGGHLSDGASPVLAAVMDMLKSNIIPARLLATLVLIRVLQSKPSISIAQALIDYAVNEIQILKQQQGTTAATSCSPDALIKQLVTGFKCLDTKSQILFLSSCCISFIQVVVSTLKKPEVFGKENLWMRHEDSLTSEQISEAGAYRKLMVSLYKMLMKGVGRFAEFSDMIKVLFANHLEKDALQFLSGVFTDSWGEFDSDVVEASLMVATAYIANISAHSKKMVDFQLFIPTLLVTLQHEKQSVRTEAINCLESVCASLSKTQIVTKSKKSNTDIFAYDSFYGSGSENLQYLTADITLKFTSTLVEFKSELIADPGYLSRALVSIIGAHVEDDSSEWQSTVLVFLCSNILAFPSVAPRIALLKAISLISSPIKITIMFPMLDVKNEIANNSQVLSLMLQCFDLQSTDSIFEAGGSSKKYYRLFSKLLKGSSLLANSSAIQLEALRIITPVWFAGLSEEKKPDLFLLITGLASSGQPEVAVEAKQVIKSISLRADLFNAVASKCYQYLSNLVQNGSSGAGDHGKSSKRQRASATDEEQSAVTSAASAATSALLESAESVYSFTALLEIQSSLIMSDKHLLLPVLFDILGAVIQLQVDKFPVSIEYFKQLLLTGLLHLVDFIRDTSIQVDVSAVRVDHLVQCIRGTDNPQTHNAALLLMASVACIFPEIVLVNIMPVFTFMGANVMRQDDNYSFHVIRKTLETILPALLKKHRSSVSGGDNSNLVLAVKPIIKVFVDALLHIPKHRRMRLFCTLVSVLGEAEFLDPVVALLLAKSATSSPTLTSSSSSPSLSMSPLSSRAVVSSSYKASASASSKDSAINASFMEFAISVASQFDVDVQVKTLLSLLQLVSLLPFDARLGEEDDHQPSSTPQALFFKATEFTERQNVAFKLACVKTTVRVLSSKLFLEKMIQSEASAEALESYHVQLVETVFNILTRVKQYSLSCSSSTVIASLTKDLLAQSYEALDKIHGLLSLTSFINVMKTLLQSNDLTISYKCMSLINDKVVAVSKSTSSTGDAAMNLEMMTSFSELVPLLAKIVEMDGSTSSSSSDKVYENKQMALICLTSMTQVMSKKFVDVYASVLPAVTSQVSSDNRNVATSAITCISCLCKALGPRTVPFMSKFMPAILKIVEVSSVSSSSTDASGSTSQLLVLGAISALSAIVLSVPKFVSPYIQPIIKCILSPAYMAVSSEDELRSDANISANNMKKRISDKRVDLLNAVTENAPVRLLVPAMYSQLAATLLSGFPSIHSLFIMVSNLLSVMTRTELMEQHTHLFKFFMLGFEYRKTCGASGTSSVVDKVEDEIISSFLQMVVKLNESTFRPLFLKLVEWAASPQLSQDVDHVTIVQRSTLFYKLMDAMLDRLKSIFAPYCGYILENALSILEDHVKSGKKVALVVASSARNELWVNVMKTLHKCFLFDSEGLVNADKYNRIYPVLLKQISITSADDEEIEDAVGELFLENMTKYVVPCIGQLAVLVNSDELWKPLNQKLMLKSRDENAKVRYACLKVLQDLYVRLGEELLVLLPETIPFLAELMEDSDEDVEMLCEKVCNQIEQFLGESIQQYFNN